MNLKKKKETNLSQTETGIRKKNRRLKSTRQYFKVPKDGTDPGAYLRGKERKQWEKLSPGKKRRFLKKGAKVKWDPAWQQRMQEQEWEAWEGKKLLKDQTEKQKKEAESTSRQTHRQYSHTGKHSQGHKSGMGGKSAGTDTAREAARTAAETAKDAGEGVSRPVSKTMEMAVKSAKKAAELYQENIRSKELSREEAIKSYNREKSQYTERDAKLNEDMEKIKKKGPIFLLPLAIKLRLAFMEVMKLFLAPVFLVGGSIVGALGGISLGSVVLVLIIFLFASGASQSQTSMYDGACYLSAKYESHGDCGSIGSGGMGEYGFDKSYSLVSFVAYCYQKDAAAYVCFEPYLGMTGAALYDSSEFRTVWRKLAMENKVTFEADQTIYTYQNYFLPAANLYTNRYGYDFVNAPDAVKACVTSFSIRDGAHSAAAYFAGTTADSTPEEIIRTAYGRMQARRPANSVSGPRWIDEEQDCLDLLHGTLDIYEPDTSPSGYGGIDWSWKKGNSATAGEGNAQVAQLALEQVGCRYSQAKRDQPGYYDCSSLVYRLYAQVGITYLSGMTAANEAQYLESNGMGVSEQELQPGDLIFYSYTRNGRYKNISHVAIYIGDGKMVHAANTRRGVVCDPYRASNIGVYARPR